MIPLIPLLFQIFYFRKDKKMNDLATVQLKKYAKFVVPNTILQILSAFLGAGAM